MLNPINLHHNGVLSLVAHNVVHFTLVVLVAFPIQLIVPETFIVLVLVVLMLLGVVLVLLLLVGVVNIDEVLVHGVLVVLCRFGVVLVSLVLHELFVLKLLLVLVNGRQLSTLLGGLGGLFLLFRPGLRGLLELLGGGRVVGGLGLSRHLGGCVVSGGWLLLIVSVV